MSLVPLTPEMASADMGDGWGRPDTQLRAGCFTPSDSRTVRLQVRDGVYPRAGGVRERRRRWHIREPLCVCVRAVVVVGVMMGGGGE